MGSIKFRLVLAPEMYEVMKRINRLTGLDDATIFRNAVIVYETLLKSIGEGEELGIIDNDGKVKTIIILPKTDT